MFSQQTSSSAAGPSSARRKLPLNNTSTNAAIPHFNDSNQDHDTVMQDYSDDVVSDDQDSDDEFNWGLEEENDLLNTNASDSDDYQAGPCQKKQKTEPTGKRMSKQPFQANFRTQKRAKGILTPDPNPPKDAQDADQDALASGAIEMDEEEKSKPYTAGAVYYDSYKCRDGVDRDSTPLKTIHEMFDNMTDKALTLGFDGTVKSLDNVAVRIGTMCSGTEAPLIASDMIKQRLQNLGHEKLFHTYHAFSGEIVPIKQDFIQRNFDPPFIFRDITELSKPLDADGKRRATTAHGGRAEVPGDIDVLIAGFCCVDFSPLNNRQKSLEDLGESGDTFFAMLGYANEARPRTIILENVLNAPWVEKEGKHKGTGKEKGNSKNISIASHLAAIGYSCIFLKADTKDFYLPHTRVRGYMVCLDNRIPGMSKKAESLLQKCKSIFESLKYPASVPVEAMLLPADDPSLRLGANEANAIGKKIEWAKCKAGHEDYRRQLRLGHKREMTHWRVDAALRNHDYFIPFSGQKERVSDTIEIAHLRNLARGFDDRYYSRNLETSQNVYRVTDVTKLGIIGCLTPTGLPFNTVRGGRITGYESMILQGMPVESLDFNALTPAQLQDLAGNAMSTTVVGAALLATLTIFHGFFDLSRREQVVERVIIPEMIGEEELTPEASSDPAVNDPISCKKLKDLAWRSTSLCYCEGRHDLFTTLFQRCKVCGHTTCLEHGKNPKHSYENIDPRVTDLRLNPDDAKTRLKASLPMKLDFDGLINAKEYLKNFRSTSDLGSENRQIAAKAIEDALKSELNFEDAIRSELWEVSFESPAAKLILTISTSSIKWLLYAKCPSHLAGDHPIRTFLEKFPIARMIPKEESIIEGSWSFWIPEVRDFEATITSKGQLENAFLSNRGLDAHVGSFVYRKCSVEIENFDEDENKKFFEFDIRGDYELSQPCGQAFNSLHTKMPKDCPPMFFYLEHEGQRGDPIDHSFVFTHCNRRLKYGDNRTTIARVDKSWRQSLIYDHSEFSEEREVSTTISVDGYWRQFEHFSFSRRVGHNVTYRHLPKDISALQLPECGFQQALFTCKYNLEGNKISFPTDKWIELGRANKGKFSRSLGWIIEKCKVLPGYQLSGIQAVDAWIPTHEDDVRRCTRCAPEEPSMNWAFPKKTAGQNCKNGHIQTPYEEPKEATVYEQALKSRPAPVSTYFRIGGNSNLEIKIGFNPSTLCHRALAVLQPEDSSETIKTSWWFATDDIKASTERLENFKLLDTGNEEPASQPPGLSTQYRLRLEQLRKLTWMEAQEDGRGVRFTEREIVEQRVQELGYLLMGQASQERFFRGGILADEVGFGKTILILALILSRFKIDEKIAQNPVPGLIPTKATVIFVPAQLPQQWKEEAQKFIQNTTKGQILVIETIAHLQKLTIEDFKSALVIIVSCNLCEADKYRLALAHLGGMVESAQKASPRAKAAWYNAAKHRLGENVEELMKRPETFGKHLDAQFRKSIAAARLKTLPIPSKRVTGAAYLKVDKKRTFDEFQDSDDEECEKLEPRLDNHNLSNLKAGVYEEFVFPLFEMFKFARVVVDEFTYIDVAHSMTMMNMSAHAYWALSGTPPLDTFPDIKHMAQFLRVNLGVHDFANMKRDVYARITSDMTASEKLLTFQPKPSQSWLKLRHAQAERFLKSFVRKDIPLITLPGCLSTVRLVSQSALEFAVYAELEQRVEATNFELKATNSEADMERYINDALDGTDRGRVALLLRASYLSILGVNSSRHQDAWTAFNAVLGFRRAQFDDLLKEWLRLMDQAVWLHHHPANRSSSILIDYVKGVQNNILGDLDVTAKCRDLANIAIREYHPQNWTRFRDAIDDYSASLKNVRIDLGKIAQNIVDYKRPLRFFDSICRIERGCTEPEGWPNCDCCGDAFDEPEDWVVLSSCGHLLCTATCSQVQEGDCPVTGCNSHCQSHQMIPGHRLAGFGKGFSSKGEKLREIAHLINQQIPEDDQVLVFVQSPQLRQKVVAAFKERGITYTDLKSNGMLSTQLTKFQHSKGRKDKVLILNIGDASASGSNLTMANHIIFVAPYLTFGSSAQQLYDAARTQAEGRANRFGQKKVVQIYDFVTEHTIDVDILEKRNEGMLLKEYELPESDPVTTIIGHRLEKAKHGEQTTFGSRLRHKIFSDDDDDDNY